MNFAEKKFKKQFSIDKYIDGFILYQKYSRKDVARILNWEFNEEATMFGYRIKYGTCPIFVNYHKEDDIAAATKFEDKFINNNEFQWFSKSNRRLDSDDVVSIKNHKNTSLLLPLFVKKSNGEGDDFYYMGNVTPIEDSFTQTSIKDNNNQDVPVVMIRLSMNQPAEDSIYNYITNE